jgi:hypothetical protein
MPGTGTTIDAVIDALLALIAGLPECAAPVFVSDGYPISEPNTIVTVGGTVEPVVEGDHSWAEIGHLAREEDYLVQVVISAYDGGFVQKTARDQAFTIFRAIDAALVADPTLGGLVRICASTLLSLKQTDIETASRGRFAALTFHVHVKNRIRQP